MKQPIPSNSPEPLKVGDRVRIVPEWQDPGDDSYERLVIEAPIDSARVLIRTIIPGFTIHPTEWIEVERLVHAPTATKGCSRHLALSGRLQTPALPARPGC